MVAISALLEGDRNERLHVMSVHVGAQSHRVADDDLPRLQSANAFMHCTSRQAGVPRKFDKAAARIRAKSRQQLLVFGVQLIHPEISPSRRTIVRYAVIMLVDAGREENYSSVITSRRDQCLSYQKMPS
jgi:hypothetical protein